MACAYLLTLDVAPSAPSLERSLTEKEKAKSRAEQVMNAMPVDGDAAEVIGATTQQGEEDLVKLELADTDPSTTIMTMRDPNPTLRKGAEPALEIDASVLHLLDLLIVTWVFVERRRREDLCAEGTVY